MEHAETVENGFSDFVFGTGSERLKPGAEDIRMIPLMPSRILASILAAGDAFEGGI